ncbi:MAG: radical SAM protein [Candidatus Eisenbacteria sp.]|nr:radical SAM protein [Candidatus Eisenbacteria bacterium]
MDSVPALELPPYRPPSEAASVLVRVTRGCAWNRCRFCGMYKDLRFSIRGLEEIEADLAMLRAAWPEAHSVFLGDSDSLVHPQLPAIVRAVRRTFPEAERITSYARLHTLWRRPAEFLQELREAGLTRIHAGLESGSQVVLEQVAKGIEPERAQGAVQKALAAGFDLSLYVLSGLGGSTAWEAHARETAAVLAAVPPHFLRLRTLVLLPGTPLFDAWQAGEFEPADPLTRLRETQLLLTELNARLNGLPCTPPAAGEESHARAGRSAPTRHREPADPASREIEICSDHFSNYIWANGEMIYGGINGFLPGDVELILAALDAAIVAARNSHQVQDPASLARAGRMTELYRAGAL